MDIDKLAEEGVKELSKAAVKEAWEKKSRLLPLLKRVLPFLRRTPGAVPAVAEVIDPPQGILILGPGGTGKTTLARFLSGDVNVLIDPPGFYEPSLFAESVPLLGAPEVELVIMPGQGYRLSREIGKVSAELVAGRYRGVIIVVDYGFHAIESEWKAEHQLYDRERPAAFLSTLLAHQRQEELDFLDRMAPTLKAITKKLWILVVVLKQDLWAGQQTEVARHYRQGEWGSRMNSIVQSLDSTMLYLHTVYASLQIQNYTTSGGRQTLKKNAAGYDAIRQRQSIEELFQAFDALREWEDRQ